MNICSSYLLLDNIMPFFVLLFIYFINVSFEKNQNWYFVIAGMCLGTAVLTKEMALIFLPLPVLVLLVLSKRQQYVKGLFFFYISFAGVILSWMTYLYFRSGELYLFLGGGGPKVVEYLSINSGIEIDFITKVQKYFNNLYNYYVLYIKK
jgi:4-amino-4-deoxy-L-arabinose transferase-like glycosyltransferase